MLPDRILVLGPHTDDAELGCGGSIARWLEQGVDVHVAVFSTAEQSLPDGSQPSRLRDECHASLDEMGIAPENRTIFSYPVRMLSYHRQEVLEKMVELGRKLDPDWILVPSGADLHQDHSTVYHEALRAFKHKTILGYELPWNHITFSASAFVTLEEAPPGCQVAGPNQVRIPTGTQSPLLHTRVHGLVGAGPGPSGEGRLGRGLRTDQDRVLT